jgi:anti-anti-sigma factor
MKRHEMALAASVGRYEDGKVAVANPRRTIALNRARLTKAATGDASFGPAGMVAREHTLILTGTLDGRSANALEAEIERLCEEKVTSITLDLSELSYIDGIGVAVVAFRCRLCQRRGYDFGLIPGSRMIHRAFEQAGVAGLLPFREGSVASRQPEADLVAGELQREPAVASAPEPPTIAPKRFERDLATPTLVPALALSHGMQGAVEQ